MDLENLKFDKDGLIPVVVQDYQTKEVLMVAYMNEQAFQKTLETGQTWLYSRSRKKLWLKGETSGNKQLVKQIKYDCDNDTLLLLVEPTGPACHTGQKTCFHRDLEEGIEKPEVIEELKSAIEGPILNQLYQVILDRKKNLPESSYTAELFKEGLEKILAKVEEESTEVVEAAKDKDKKEVVHEVSDLLYHLLVMLAYKEISVGDIEEELEKRRK